MKEHTSRFLKSVAWMFLTFPATYLIYASLLFSIPASRTMSTFFTPSFWLLSLFGVLTGYGLREMTRWAWYVFLLTCLFIGYANALLVVKYSQSSNKLLAFGVSIGLLLFLIIRLGKEIRVPYFLPKIRWWEANPRYKLLLPVKVAREQSTFEGEIMDISMGGCFIKSRVDLVQNERIRIEFTIFGEPLALKGTVVWRSQSTVTHPKGVGVKFDSLVKIQRKVLKAATIHLKKIAAVQSLQKILTPEEFEQKIAALKAHRLGVTKAKTPPSGEPPPSGGENELARRSS